MGGVLGDVVVYCEAKLLGGMAELLSWAEERYIQLRGLQVCEAVRLWGCEGVEV